MRGRLSIRHHPGERLTPAEMVRRTPIICPTFVAPPRRLAALMAMARTLSMTSRHWGVKSYENDDADDALDAGFDRVHGELYDELMDDRNPLTYEQVQQKLADARTLEASIEALREAPGAGLPPKPGTTRPGWRWRASSSDMPS